MCFPFKDAMTWKQMNACKCSRSSGESITKYVSYYPLPWSRSPTANNNAVLGARFDFMYEANAAAMDTPSMSRAK